MRKIVSKQEEGKKQKRNQLIIGIILIIVMFGSTFGIIVNSFGKENSNTKVKYNGLEFTKQNERWFVNIGDFQFSFKYNPYEVEEIGKDSGLKYLNNYYNKPLYLSSQNTEASSEIYTNIEGIAQRVQGACLEEENCEGNLPVKNCTSNFIIIKESDSNEIKQEENCVFISGTEENLTKISDEFLFQIIGVRQ